MADVARLREALRDAGPRGGIDDRLPLLAPMQPLFKGRLRRGAVVAIEGEAGRSSLAMMMLAGVSSAGGWCGVVNVPSFGCLAAHELDIRLEALALVPQAGAAWADAVGALVTGMDAVLVATSAQVSGALARRLAAKARQHRCTLFTLGPVWEGSDVRVSVRHQEWVGLGQGRGRLRSRRLTVVASHRPNAELVLWLPGEDGRVRTVEDRTTPVGLPTTGRYVRAG
ncbi:hypothetical protein OG792_24120 [Micromonospora sp. NBC_01699]|uniref:hypothetical protein n=1 Tax=Micromonospora sp. NBC_01699 TaxID=2975984 RepID=UPI002E2BB4E6|nr:hypothetical protein [Micromonospora sp. NBC_01699]